MCLCTLVIWKTLPFLPHRPNHGRDCAGLCCGVRLLCSSLCTSVFQCLQASCGFNLISLLKTIEPACHPVFLARIWGTLLKSSGCRMHVGCVSPHWTVWMEEITVKITAAWSSAVFLPFPRQKHSNSLALLLARSSSESPREVGRKQFAVLRFQENTGLLNIPEPLVGKPGTVC